jgi:hypothetical protein
VFLAVFGLQFIPIAIMGMLFVFGYSVVFGHLLAVAFAADFAPKENTTTDPAPSPPVPPVSPVSQKSSSIYELAYNAAMLMATVVAAAVAVSQWLKGTAQ